MILKEKLKAIIDYLLAKNSHIDNINVRALIEENSIEDGYITRKDTGKRFLMVCYSNGPVETR
jgi:hypothetical protein